MAHRLASLIQRERGVRPVTLAPAQAPLPVNRAILDRSVARRLGVRALPPRPLFTERDLLDGAMTFALVFTGAMVFLF
jgi:hypothetical protein